MSLTRRAVLKSSVAVGLSALAAEHSPLAFAQPPRTRFNATSAAGKAMLAKYAQAVGVMMDPSKYPPSDPRSWSFQWYTHWIPGPQQPWPAVVTAKQQMIDQVYAGKPATDPHRQLAKAMWDDCQAHGRNPSDPNAFQQLYFCIWHRYFVYYFEEIVRAVLNDQTFTLPYWNYLGGTVGDLSIPPEFRDPASPLYRSNRNPWVNAGDRIDLQNPGSLNLDALNEPLYIDQPDGDIGFCPILDNNPHGLVHGYVGDGTNMGKVPTAAGDPIFWLHHCCIDRLWESWNRLGYANPSWPSRRFPFADAQGHAVGVLPANANRTSMLNYRYDSYATAPAPSQVLTATIRQMPAMTKALAPDAVTLGADRVRTSLTPAFDVPGVQPSVKSLFGLSSDGRRLYLVLGGISATSNSGTTYNVFLDLPEGTAPPGTGSPNYLGTLHFFAAGGHDDHEAGHRIAFNVTAKVQRLLASNALTATPSVTFIRQGAGDDDQPTVRQVMLVEG